MFVHLAVVTYSSRGSLYKTIYLMPLASLRTLFTTPSHTHKGPLVLLCQNVINLKFIFVLSLFFYLYSTPLVFLSPFVPLTQPPPPHRQGALTWRNPSSSPGLLRSDPRFLSLDPSRHLGTCCAADWILFMVTLYLYLGLAHIKWHASVHLYRQICPDVQIRNAHTVNVQILFAVT